MVGRQGVTSAKRGALRQTSRLYDSPILPHSENEISIARSSDSPTPPNQRNPRDPGFRGTFLDSESKHVSNQKSSVGTSLAVQWLRFWASTA